MARDSHFVERRHRDRRRFRLPALLIVVLVVAAGLVLTARRIAEPGVTVRVDFDTATAASPRSNIGFTATTLAVDGGATVQDERDVSALGRLGVGAVRIHLRSKGDGTVVTGALGGAQEIPADRWLAAYCGMGPLTVVVDLNKDGAVDVLKYLRTTDCPVHRFVLGNEMDANSQADVAPAEYVRRFREIARALRAVEPTLEVGGPAPAYFEGLSTELVDGLLRAPPSERASFIDFHAYGAGRGEQATMSSSWRYAEQLDLLRTMIDDPAVGMQVGEFNLNWGEDPRANTHFQSVWMASALGSILSRGAVAFQYGDKNNASGLVAVGAPKASYWGLAAFTGGGQFRPFGTTMVDASSTNATVRVFASRDDKNVVLVNTGDARSVRLRLDGFARGTAAVWQSDAGAFRASEPTTVGSELDLDLPGLSITVVVLDG